MATEINYFKSICKVSRAFGSTFSKSKLLDLIVASAIESECRHVFSLAKRHAGSQGRYLEPPVLVLAMGPWLTGFLNIACSRLLQA